MDSRVNRVAARSVQKRPAILSLKGPAKKTEDTIPLLVPVPLHRKVQAMHCPMSPMTPDLDVDECLGRSQSNTTFTLDLLSPTTPRGLSFTVYPSSPLDESMVYALPPRKRTASTNFQMRPPGLPTNCNHLSIEFGPPLPEDPLEDGTQSPSEDRKYFHVRFLQEDPPFPQTPDY